MNKNKIALLKIKYKEGMRVELISMNDMQAPPPGTQGTIMGVDDIGSILVKWDNGSTLSLIPDEDEFKRI